MVAIFSKCLAVSREEAKRSSLLRSTADNTLAHVVLVVFSRARLVNHRHHHRNAKKGFSGNDYTGNSPNDSKIEDMKAQVQVQADDGGDDDDVAWPGSDNETPHNGGGDNSYEHGMGGSSGGSSSSSSAGTDAAITPEARGGTGDASSATSVPATVAIMQALSSLCNPRATHKPPQAQGGGLGGVGGSHSTNKKTNNNEESAAIALSLVNVAIEAGGEHLGECPQLVEVMQVCKMPSLLLCSRGWFLALTLLLFPLRL